MIQQSIKYKVCINFVDDTYWDDGSRWTHQTFNFDNLSQAVDFAKKAITKGCTLNGKHDTISIKIDKDDIKIYEERISEVQWAK